MERRKKSRDEIIDNEWRGKMADEALLCSSCRDADSCEMTDINVQECIQEHKQGIWLKV